MPQTVTSTLIGMNTKRKYDERDMLAEGQLLTPNFPSHAGQAGKDELNQPEQWPFWRRAMAKAGIMPNTSNQFPRINPTVIALLVLIMGAVIALVGGALSYGELRSDLKHEREDREKVEKRVQAIEDSRQLAEDRQRAIYNQYLSEFKDLLNQEAQQRQRGK